jgi:hypothetical protein
MLFNDSTNETSRDVCDLDQHQLDLFGRCGLKNHGGTANISPTIRAAAPERRAIAAYISIIQQCRPLKRCEDERIYPV